EKDPFGLTVGESTGIRLEAAGGLSYGELVAGAQLFLDGDLFCDQKSTSASTRRVAGRAWGWASVNARVQQGSEVETHQPSPIFLPVTAELELQPASGGGGSLVITVTTQQ